MAAITVAAGLGAAATVYGANKQEKASREASRAQERANALSIEESRNQDALNRAEAKPWLDAGKWAVEKLERDMRLGNFDYQKFETENIINPELFSSGKFVGNRIDGSKYTQGAFNTEKMDSQAYVQDSYRSNALNPNDFTPSEYSSNNLDAQRYTQDEYAAQRFSGDLDLKKDPSYQFRLQEGINALDRSAANRGKLFSGQQQRAITDYGQQAASQEYAAAYNRERDKHSYNNDINAKEYGINQDRLNQQLNIESYNNSLNSDDYQKNRQRLQDIRDIRNYNDDSSRNDYLMNQDRLNNIKATDSYNRNLSLSDYEVNQNRLNSLLAIEASNYGRDAATYNSGVAQNALMAELTSQAYNQDLSRFQADNQTTANNYNLLAGLSGVGQQQVQNSNALSTGISNNIAQAQVNNGRAIAQGHINSGNASSQMAQGLTNVVGGGIGLYGQKQGWFDSSRGASQPDTQSMVSPKPASGRANSLFGMLTNKTANGGVA